MYRYILLTYTYYVPTIKMTCRLVDCRKLTLMTLTLTHCNNAIVDIQKIISENELTFQ